MLLNDYKSIYIGNKEVKKIYYNNQKYYPLNTEPNPFDVYSWQEIKDIVVSGEAPNRIPLGTTFSFIKNTYNNSVQENAMVVDYVYNDKPTLVVFVPWDYKNYWASSGKQKVDYANSEPYSALSNINMGRYEEGFYNILCQRNITFNVPGGTKDTRTVYHTLPSISEVTTMSTDTYSDHGMLEYFKENPNYENPLGRYAWTRTCYTVNNVTTYIWKGVKSSSMNNYYSKRTQYYTYYLLFIGE